MMPRTVPHQAGDTNTASAGLPAWMSDALVKETICVWQPYYDETLTVDDAIEILTNVGHLAKFLTETDDEAFCGPGKGFQP